MKKVVAIMGSYRKNGLIDTIVQLFCTELQKLGSDIIKHDLLDKKIEFCINCRQCTQEPGPERGQCIHDDDFNQIMNDIDQADTVIFAAPTNFFTVNALTKRFIERLVCTAYWPFGQGGPTPRSTIKSKNAVLITSTAMPAFMGRLFTGTLRVLKIAAKTMGAETLGTLFIGSSVLYEKPAIAPTTKRKIEKLAQKIMR